MVHLMQGTVREVGGYDSYLSPELVTDLALLDVARFPATAGTKTWPGESRDRGSRPSGPHAAEQVLRVLECPWCSLRFPPRTEICAEDGGLTGLGGPDPKTIRLERGWRWPL